MKAKSNKVKISVIVPVCNTEKYLGKCLTSLAGQTLDDIEIIVVNDGSTDGSQVIIDDFAAKHPGKIVALRQENKGLGQARNLGVEAARGGYIGFVDSDDWVEPDMFELMYKTAKLDDSDVVICDFYMIDETGKSGRAAGIWSGRREEISTMAEFVLHSTDPAMACNKIFKRDLLLQTRFTDGYYEDVATIPVIVSNCGRISFIKEPLYYYFQRTGAITSQRNELKNLAVIKAWERCLSECNPDYRNEMAYAVYFNICSLMDFRKEHRAEYFEFFRRSEDCFKGNMYIDEAIRSYKLADLFSIKGQPEADSAMIKTDTQAAAQEQFEKEAAALTRLIRDMIDAGQVPDAGQLLEQYALLNPSDPQIPELRKAIGPADAPSACKCPPFLKQVESIHILQALPSKKSGLPASVFGKLTVMEEKLGYLSTILTTRHDINMRKKEVWLKTFTGSVKILSPGIKILNVYEFFQKSCAEGLANRAIYGRAGGNDGLRYVKESEDTYGVYEGDTIVRQDEYSGYRGSLRAQRHFSGGKRVKDIFFDDRGYLNNIVEYDPDSRDICTVKYYTTGGELIIETLCSIIDSHRVVNKMTIFNEDGSVMTEHGSEAMLTALCLSELTDNIAAGGADRFSLLVFEDVTKTASIAYLDRSRINGAMVVPMHLPFLEDAYNLSSPVVKEYKYFCGNVSKFDGVVFLTQGAMEDFERKFKDAGSTFVIPHPYYQQILRAPFEERDNRKAVIIARLAPQKAIDVAVEIFSTVVKALPDVRLEIYGAGGANDDDYKKIKMCIKELGMENNIFLMSYVDDVSAVYSKAAAFIMTSKFEGYGLTLMESICNGCPAFSFDIKYGPSDIIKDGETGFLFERGDKEGFAAKLKEYFENAQMQRTMSENCYNDAPGFGTDAFLEKWVAMAEELYRRCKK